MNFNRWSRPTTSQNPYPIPSLSNINPSANFPRDGSNRFPPSYSTSVPTRAPIPPSDPYDDLLHGTNARIFDPPVGSYSYVARNNDYNRYLHGHEQVPKEPQSIRRDFPPQHSEKDASANSNFVRRYGEQPISHSNSGQQQQYPQGMLRQHQHYQQGILDNGQQYQQEMLHNGQQQYPQRMVPNPTTEASDPIASYFKERMNKVSYFNVEPQAQKAQPFPMQYSLINGMQVSQTDGSNAPAYTRQGEFIPPDVRNVLKLKKLLGVPENKELWFETRTGSSALGNIANVALEEDKAYYYNPSTLKVTFEKPPLYAHLMQQSECQKILDMMTPCTLIVKRINNSFSEEALRNFFEQFGKIAFAKVCKFREVARNHIKASQRNLAYFRMETIQAQRKIVEQVFFMIDGLEVEVRIPANRIFVARVPDQTSAGDLQRFFRDEIDRTDPNGYIIDTYFPHPYRQFAFCTVGGMQIAVKLALKADYFFRDTSITVATCHTDSEVNAEQLFDQKIRDLVERNELARVRSLQNISSEVKFLLKVLAKMKKFETSTCLLMEINNEFLKCTEEKLRNYLFVQDHVLDICKIISLKEDGDEDPVRKRKRATGDPNGENEVHVQEITNFEEDDTAHLMNKNSQFMINPTARPTEKDAATTHIMKIMTSSFNQ